MNEGKYLMNNYGDRGGSAEADNTLLDLHNSSYDTKADLNNCFFIHSKYSLVANEPSERRRSDGEAAAE